MSQKKVKGATPPGSEPSVKSHPFPTQNPRCTAQGLKDRGPRLWTAGLGEHTQNTHPGGPRRHPGDIWGRSSRHLDARAGLGAVGWGRLGREAEVGRRRPSPQHCTAPCWGGHGCNLCLSTPVPRMPNALPHPTEFTLLTLPPLQPSIEATSPGSELRVTERGRLAAGPVSSGCPENWTRWGTAP